VESAVEEPANSLASVSSTIDPDLYPPPIHSNNNHTHRRRICSVHISHSTYYYLFFLIL